MVENKYLVNNKGDSARPKGRTRYWYASPPKANLRTLLWFWRICIWNH